MYAYHSIIVEVRRKLVESVLSIHLDVGSGHQTQVPGLSCEVRSWFLVLFLKTYFGILLVCPCFIYIYIERETLTIAHTDLNGNRLDVACFPSAGIRGEPPRPTV